MNDDDVLLDETPELNKSGILEQFYELEDKYKTEGGPEGITNVLNIFNVTERKDLIPSRIYEIYKEDWSKYCGLMKCWDRLEQECDSEDEEDEFSIIISWAKDDKKYEREYDSEDDGSDDHNDEIQSSSSSEDEKQELVPARKIVISKPEVSLTSRIKQLKNK